jgi:hypothetical protein
MTCVYASRRFVEFASFASTLCASWFVAALLTGGYAASASRNLPTALVRTSLAWLVAMPVAASQLVLTAAAESRALVATDGFASVLPLAASGPGEPLVSAAGVLGVMAVWRCFYVTYLDAWDQQQAVQEAALLTQVLAQVSTRRCCLGAVGTRGEGMMGAVGQAFVMRRL